MPLTLIFLPRAPLLAFGVAAKHSCYNQSPSRSSSVPTKTFLT
jgi:hypothetical protein